MRINHPIHPNALHGLADGAVCGRGGLRQISIFGGVAFNFSNTIALKINLFQTSQSRIQIGHFSPTLLTIWLYASVPNRIESIVIKIRAPFSFYQYFGVL
jgi:hypothetical protein